MNAADGKNRPAIYKPRTPISAWDFENSTFHNPEPNGHPFPVQYCATNESVALVAKWNADTERYDWPIFLFDLPHLEPVDLKTVVVWGHQVGKAFTGCDNNLTHENTPNLGFEFIMSVEKLYVRDSVSSEISIAETNGTWRTEFLALNGVSETAWNTYRPGHQQTNSIELNWEAANPTTFMVETRAYQDQGGEYNVQILRHPFDAYQNLNIPMPLGPDVVIGLGEPPVELAGTARGNCWRPKILCCGLDS